MNAEYLDYPPRIADDVEINEQRDGGRSAFIVGSQSAGRFILLGEIELRVLRLLTGALTPLEVCEEFKQLHNAKLTTQTLKKFLARIDEAGLLAGKRICPAGSSNLTSGPQFYLRWKLFNPDRLFERMIPVLRWIWTPGFVAFSALLAVAACVLAMGQWPAIESYGLYTVREHYVAILIAGLFVGFTHEFAHGLTCKAFGGRVPEVGVLMIYYLLPALYCNVSGAYLIRERRKRLWVIAAGVYWQLLVGIIALLTWFIVEPHTLISDAAFIFFLGSVVDVIFNANPLIKLDGYYFLSQWTGLPNLMDRSRAYWREMLKRTFFGEGTCKGGPSVAAPPWHNDAREPQEGAATEGGPYKARRQSRRERSIYAVFGLTSFAYTLVLRMVIVFYVGAYLADRFNLGGLIVAAGLAAFYMRRPLAQISSATGVAVSLIHKTLLRAMRRNAMKTPEEKASCEPESLGPAIKIRRRRIVLAGCALVLAIALCVPWNASVGSYGSLGAMPHRETVVRAPEDATLIDLRVQPGDAIGAGSLIGRMGNLALEEQIVQAESDLARANADYERLKGEFRVREEAAARAELQLNRRRHEFTEINSEQKQIDQRLRASAHGAVRLVNAASSSGLPGVSYSVSDYPPAMAVLQADVDMFEVQVQEANARADRSRSLFNRGVLPRSETESVETRAASLSLELVRARERLEAALIEHRRSYTGSSIELEQAGSDLRTEHLQTAFLSRQIDASRELIRMIQSRLDLVRRKRAQFELCTPRSGTVYGEDLPRMVRRYFQKGEEICRVADTEHLLVRIQLPEREIGDVRVGHRARLKVRAYPDRVFHGEVSKIGSESERDEHNQTTYRVELSLENVEGLLRPGMTAFARIDFDHQMIGQILLHKLRQLLRPELWML